MQAELEMDGEGERERERERRRAARSGEARRRVNVLEGRASVLPSGQALAGGPGVTAGGRDSTQQEQLARKAPLVLRCNVAVCAVRCVVAVCIICVLKSVLSQVRDLNPNSFFVVLF